MPISLPSHAPLDLKFSTERLLPGQYGLRRKFGRSQIAMNVELAPTLLGQTLVQVPGKWAGGADRDRIGETRSSIDPIPRSTK